MVIEMHLKYWIENYFCTRADIFNCCLCLDILKCVEYNYLGSQARNMKRRTE